MLATIWETLPLARPVVVIVVVDVVCVVVVVVCCIVAVLCICVVVVGVLRELKLYEKTVHAYIYIYVYAHM